VYERTKEEEIMTKKKVDVKLPRFVNPTPIKYVDVIFWQDAYTSSEGGPEFDKKENILTLSVGFIVKEDKDFVHMSHFYDGISSELSEPFTSIPVGMIKKRRKVRI
jgi:hypothetical protein